MVAAIRRWLCRHDRTESGGSPIPGHERTLCLDCGALLEHSPAYVRTRLSEHEREIHDPDSRKAVARAAMAQGRLQEGNAHRLAVDGWRVIRGGRIMPDFGDASRRRVDPGPHGEIVSTWGSSEEIDHVRAAWRRVRLVRGGGGR